MTYATRELLVQAWIPSAAAAVYTSTGGNTIIDKISTTNTDTAVRDVSMYVVASGGSASLLTLIKTKSLAPGDCYLWPEVVGKTIAAGATVQASAGAASKVNIGISGRVGT